MEFECKRGKCLSDGKGKIIPESEAIPHAIEHFGEDITLAVKGVAEQGEKIQSGVANTIRSLLEQMPKEPKEAIPPVHAGIDEMQKHMDDCPTCQAQFHVIKDGIIAEHEAGKKKPEAPPAQPAQAKVEEPAPTKPQETTQKVLVFPTEDEVPGSPLSQSAFGVKRIKTDKGIALFTDSEETGTEAVEAGVVPKCRWQKDKEGNGYWACEEN